MEHPCPFCDTEEFFSTITFRALYSMALSIVTFLLEVTHKERICPETMSNESNGHCGGHLESCKTIVRIQACQNAQDFAHQMSIAKS